MRSSVTGIALTVAVLVLGVVLAALLSGTAARASLPQQVAERGPATLIVGTLFTLAAPPSLLIGAARGRPVRLHVCRLEHGVEMIVAGAVLLPAGLVLAPFYPSALPGTWLDGIVDAFQEDYCSRPLASLLP
ncbi:MAG: hypothetical protein ACE5I7_11710 [Candidatus Binatia bacterium]